MIFWSDEAIEAAKSRIAGETGSHISSAAVTLILDAAAEAQTAAEFPGFKEWMLEGEYHRGRAEALEEAARLLDRERQPMLADCVRALKEKQG